MLYAFPVEMVQKGFLSNKGQVVLEMPGTITHLSPAICFDPCVYLNYSIYFT